jgi:hypothetical protein
MVKDIFPAQYLIYEERKQNLLPMNLVQSLPFLPPFEEQSLKVQDSENTSNLNQEFVLSLWVLGVM